MAQFIRPPKGIGEDLPKQAMKNDGDYMEKPPMYLLSWIALRKVAQVMGFGAQKYEAENWRDGMLWSRNISAALRHIFAYASGERKDPESGVSHLAHAMCCLMFILDWEDTKQEFDDLYKRESIKYEYGADNDIDIRHRSEINIQ